MSGGGTDDVSECFDVWIQGVTRGLCISGVSFWSAFLQTSYITVGDYEQEYYRGHWYAW